MKRIIIAFVVIILLAVGGFALYQFLSTPEPVAEVQQPTTPTPTTPEPTPEPANSAELNDNLDIAIDELGAIPQ